MNKITIELTTDQMCRLKAYTKAFTCFVGEHDYQTCEKMAALIVSLTTEHNDKPFMSDKESMEIYNREYKRLIAESQNS